MLSISHGKDTVELSEQLDRKSGAFESLSNKGIFRKIQPSRIRTLSNSIEERSNEVRSSIGSDLPAHGKEVGMRYPSKGEIDLPNEKGSVSSNHEPRSYKGNELDLSVNQINQNPKPRSVNENITSWVDGLIEDEKSISVPPIPLSQDSSNWEEERMWGPDTPSLKVVSDPLKTEQKCMSKNIQLRNSKISHLFPPNAGIISDTTSCGSTTMSQWPSEISTSFLWVQRSPAMSPYYEDANLSNERRQLAQSSRPKTPNDFLNGFLPTPKFSCKRTWFPKVWPGTLWSNGVSRNIRLVVQDSCPNSRHDLYWDQALYAETIRRRCISGRKRKWRKQNIERVIKKIEKVGNVMDTKSYYTLFRLNNGRTQPWYELIFSVIWTSVFLCLHKNYLNLGPTLLKTSVEPWFHHSLNFWFGVTLGYLLYIQAESSSSRWVEARVQWQSIITNSKSLTVLLGTHLRSLRLTKYGIRLILGHTICVRNYLQERTDRAWKDNMLEVLDQKIVDKIMRYPRRLRYLAVVYGLQRLVGCCTENKILPKEVIRDINPTMVRMSHSLGACNRIRFTKLPWIIYLHLQFILFLFILALPLTLVGLDKNNSELSESDIVFARRLGIFEIYIYEIIIAYAFFGLSRMANEIVNPFSFTRENHSFGFWGFYTFWSVVEMENLRKIFCLRATKPSSKVLQDGIYGDKWTREKLEIPIRRTINTNLSKAHNLYGRTEHIRNQLALNKRKSSYWADFRIDPSDDSSSFTFSSDSEDEQFIISQSHVRNSICYDLTYS